MNNLKEILKIMLIFILLIVFSPVIFGVLGFLMRSLFFLVVFGAIIITGVVFYFKYKAKKIKKQYEDNPSYSANYNMNNKDEYEAGSEDTIIDYSDSPIIDVEFEEEEEQK
ncbi:hypothetical protein [Clostridium sp.]|uniref:hypothetical protein n=1 Tax=Clostridium sp. TaxID=1506 RepID=UPI002FC8B726